MLFCLSGQTTCAMHRTVATLPHGKVTALAIKQFFHTAWTDLCMGHGDYFVEPSRPIPNHRGSHGPSTASLQLDVKQCNSYCTTLRHITLFHHGLHADIKGRDPNGARLLGIRGRQGCVSSHRKALRQASKVDSPARITSKRYLPWLTPVLLAHAATR